MRYLLILAYICTCAWVSLITACRWRTAGRGANLSIHLSRHIVCVCKYIVVLFLMFRYETLLTRLHNCRSYSDRTLYSKRGALHWFLCRTSATELDLASPVWKNTFWLFNLSLSAGLYFGSEPDGMVKKSQRCRIRNLCKMTRNYIISHLCVCPPSL